MTAIDTSPRPRVATRSAATSRSDPGSEHFLLNDNRRLVQRNCRLRAALEAIKLNNAALQRRVAQLTTENERLNDELAVQHQGREPRPADANARHRDALCQQWSRNP